MGGKSSPDYGAIATQEGDESQQAVRDQLYANRPSQYTPWGYTNWQQDETTDANGNPVTKWTQTQGLTPELQDILNKQIAIQGGKTDIAGMMTGRMGNEFGTAMDWRGLNPMGQVPTAQYTLPENTQMQNSYAGIDGVADPYGTRQHAEDAMYSQAMSRLQPQFESEQANLEIKMRNQGLRPGDQAWQSQIDSMERGQNDARNQAQWSASEAGRAESGQMFDQSAAQRNIYTGERDRLFGQGNQAAQQAYNQALGANAQNWNQSLAGSNYANQIRQQQMTEAMQKRGFSLNEMNALLSGQQVGMPSMPNFSQSGQYQPGDQMGAAAQQASTDAANSPWGAISGLAGQALGGWATTWSDRRLKKNIKRIGTVKGHPWYSYDYIWGESSEGVMADEIPQEHVVDIGGLKAVNYGTLLGE